MPLENDAERPSRKFTFATGNVTSGGFQFGGNDAGARGTFKFTNPAPNSGIFEQNTTNPGETSGIFEQNTNPAETSGSTSGVTGFFENSIESHPFQDLAALRVSLIGNKDLKYKIIRELPVVQSLVRGLKRVVIFQIMHTNPATLNSDGGVDELETRLVILKILIVFVDEIAFKERTELEDNIAAFDYAIDPILQVLKYYVEVLLPHVYQFSSYSPHLIQKFENIITYAVDIFICLNNAKARSYNYDQESGINTLWKFVTTSLIVSDHNTTINSSTTDGNGACDYYPIVSSKVLNVSMKLVPLLLTASRDNEATSLLMTTLLSTLLKRLNKQCESICDFHFPFTSTDTFDNRPDYLNEISFKSTRLPSIEPNSDFFRSKIDLPLFIDLITSTAQIFSFLKTVDKSVSIVGPASPSSSQNHNVTSSLKSNLVVLSPKVYLALLLSLKYDNKLLNLVALNLLHLYLTNVLKSSPMPSKEVKNEVVKNYRKLFPRIVDLLDANFTLGDIAATVNDPKKPNTRKCDPLNAAAFASNMRWHNKVPVPIFLESPARILCTLAHGFRFIRDEIGRFNVDYKILNSLSALVKCDTSLENMYLLKKLSDNGTKLVDFTALVDLERNQRSVNSNLGKINRISKVINKKSQNYHRLPKGDRMDTLGDYLLLLSIYVGEKEEYRHRVVDYTSFDGPKNLLAQITFELIDNYRFLLMQIQMIYNIIYEKDGTIKITDKNDLRWFGKNLGVILSLIGHRFYFSIFHLIRSLSRSVHSLRTFFVECNSFASILDLADNKAVDGAGAEVTGGDNEGRPNQPVITTTSISSGGESITVNVNGNASGTSGAANLSGNLRYSREGLPSNGSFISSILHILRINEESSKLIQLFVNFDSRIQDDYKRLVKFNNPMNKLIILGAVANFVLDFSSFRYDVVTDDYFLRNISLIYNNANKNAKTSKNSNELFQNHSIQLTVLQILKNYSFNENQENKKELLEFIPISLLFEKSLYGIISEQDFAGFEEGDSFENQELKELKLKQKVLAFDILRNLTAGSLYFSEKICDFYLDYYQLTRSEYEFSDDRSVPSNWDEYLIRNILNFESFVEVSIPEGNSKFDYFIKNDELLLRLILNEDYVKFVTSLNYVEDHRYTNIANFKRADFPSKKLLLVWEKFLAIKLTPSLERKLAKNDLSVKIELKNNLNEIRLSIVWILINLTFKNEEFNYQFPDLNHFRLYDIIRSEENDDTETTSRRSSVTNANNNSTSGAGNYRIVIDDTDTDGEGESNPQQAHPVTTQHRSSGPSSNLINFYEARGEDADMAEDKSLTAVERAKILHEEGITLALHKLYVELSSAHSEDVRAEAFRKRRQSSSSGRRDSSGNSSGNNNNTTGGVRSNLSSSIKRFDELNSNSLLEKVMTARIQIIELLNEDGRFMRTTPPAEGVNYETHSTTNSNDNSNAGSTRTRRLSSSGSGNSRRRRRRSSNIITSTGSANGSSISGRRPVVYSGTVSSLGNHRRHSSGANQGAGESTGGSGRGPYGPDVNRGGEGFGYGSDEEYLEEDGGGDEVIEEEDAEGTDDGSGGGSGSGSDDMSDDIDDDNEEDEDEEDEEEDDEEDDDNVPRNTANANDSAEEWDDDYWVR